MNNDKAFQMDFGKVYGLLGDKATKKGRTKTEADEVICWLTEYKTSKGTIQLPYSKLLPLELIG